MPLCGGDIACICAGLLGSVEFVIMGIAGTTPA